jgi:hypothetical protein
MRRRTVPTNGTQQRGEKFQFQQLTCCHARHFLGRQIKSHAHAATRRRRCFCLGTKERLLVSQVISSVTEEKPMSVKGEIKEGAGYIKEEMNEHKKDPKSQQKAQEGRDLRNEGRIEDGKAPKTTPPGTGH